MHQRPAKTRNKLSHMLSLQPTRSLRSYVHRGIGGVNVSILLCIETSNCYLSHRTRFTSIPWHPRVFEYVHISCSYRTKSFDARTGTKHDICIIPGIECGSRIDLIFDLSMSYRTRFPFDIRHNNYCNIYLDAIPNLTLCTPFLEY